MNPAPTARAEYHGLLVDRAVAEEVDPDLALDPDPPGHPESLDALWAALIAMRNEEQQRGAEAVADATRILLGYAPTALIDGCWLASTVKVRRAHDALGAACIDALYIEHGEGDAARHHGNLYRAALAAVGFAVPDPASEAFARDARFHDADFALALVGLRLGRHGGDRLPEILGFHAATTLLGPPAVVARAAALGALPGRFFEDHAPDAPNARRACEAARRCLEAYAAQPSADFARVERGAWSLLQSRRAWEASPRPAGASSAWRAMIDLVASKARHAFGFHARVLVEGRSLDESFDPERLDARGLLARLARSSWVVPGDAGASPLVTRAVRFGGPMFGVFSEAEIAVIHAWIAALGTDLDPPPEQAPSLSAPEPASLRATARSRAPQPLPLPEMYHRLLCSPDDAESDALARTHVDRMWGAARRRVSLRKLRAERLWPWSSKGLERWIEARLHDQVFGDGGPNAQQQAASGDADTAPDAAVTHDEVVWLLTQLAPAALVDGAWLQGATAPGASHHAVSALLFRIYRDELGAGVPHQHHGNVLRRALFASRVALPPCDSRAFVEWAGFVPEAFAMPVLWLAVARGGTDLLPELLGLNLAIEMAGIGRGYARATALLRRHDIDPYFFELHNTIDNAASGHTAWSAEAIGLYMDGQAALGDPPAVERAFVRLWQGYAAYDLASRPLVWAVAKRLGPRVGFRWLRRRLFGPAPVVSG